jgi:peptide/nickel transport system substrate-binding protein
MVDAVPLKDVDSIKAAPNLQVYSVSGSTTYDYLAFNLTRPLLQNKQVRQAIAMAMDKNAIVQTIMSGHATPALVPLPHQHWAYSDIAGYTFDVDKAKQTLASAGVSGSIETSITVSPSYPEQVQMAELLQANLAKIGVKLNVESMEWSAWLDKVVQKKDFDSFISYSSPVGWDPDAFFYYLYHTGEALNLGAYSNPQVDMLLQKAQQGATQDERKATYKQIMEILVDEVPRIIIDHRELDVGAQKSVQGFHLNERGDLLFAPVSLSA